MWLPDFRLHRPADLPEALRIKADLGNEVRPLAGGTDLLPNYKWHIEKKPDVLALSGLRELQDFGPRRIGAGVRLAQLERDRTLSERLPEVVSTVRKIASPLLRSSGTIGGNLMLDTRCHWVNQSEFWRHSQNFCLKTDEAPKCLVVPGKPHCVATYSGDLAPLLMVLDASMITESTQGERETPMRNFFVDDGVQRHNLRPDELLTAVQPEDAPDWDCAYEKLRLRGSIDFPSAGLAMALKRDADSVGKLRVANTAVASCPEDLSAHFDELAGAPLSAHTAERVAAIVEKNCRPYKNVPLPPSYRKTWLRVTAERLFLRLAGIDAPAPG